MYQQLDQGKVVILDFWASWCEPCFESFPELESIWNSYGADGDNSVMIYALEMDNTTWFEQEVRDNVGIEYPVFNNGHNLHPDWNLEGYPSYAVICPDRSWELVFGNLGNNPSYLLNFVNACPAPSSALHDARPIDYVGTQDLCGTSDFVPVIRIQNRGADLMTSAAIETWVNGTLQYTFQWTGSLMQYYVSDEIVMPAVPGAGPTVNALFRITEVNGADDSNPSDNELEVSIGQSLPGTAVTLEIFAEEFNWSVAYALYDETGALIDTLDVPTSQPIVQEWELDPGVCYRFLITDYLGEGLGNQGYYKLKDHLGNIFVQGGQFGSSAEHTFFVDGLFASIDEEVQDDLAIYPNPTNGIVHIPSLNPVRSINVFDALGKCVGTYSGNITSIDLSDLNTGLYQIMVQYVDDTSKQGTVVLTD